MLTKIYKYNNSLYTGNVMFAIFLEDFPSKWATGSYFFFKGDQSIVGLLARSLYSKGIYMYNKGHAANVLTTWTNSRSFPTWPADVPLSKYV